MNRVNPKFSMVLTMQDIDRVLGGLNKGEAIVEQKEALQKEIEKLQNSLQSLKHRDDKKTLMAGLNQLSENIRDIEEKTGNGDSYDDLSEKLSTSENILRELKEEYEDLTAYDCFFGDNESKQIISRTKLSESDTSPAIKQAFMSGLFGTGNLKKA